MGDARTGATTLRAHPVGGRSLSGPGAPFPPTLIFVAGLGAGWWMEAAVPSTEMFARVYLHALGGSLLALGIALFAWGLATFARARTGIMLQDPATEVVASGPYGWSRNPQYVAFVLLYVGVSLIAGLAWALLLLPLIVVAVARLVIRREERYMRRTFGEAYSRYCERVPRWV